MEIGVVCHTLRSFSALLGVQVELLGATNTLHPIKVRSLLATSVILDSFIFQQLGSFLQHLGEVTLPSDPLRLPLQIGNRIPFRFLTSLVVNVEHLTRRAILAFVLLHRPVARQTALNAPVCEVRVG